MRLFCGFLSLFGAFVFVLCVFYALKDWAALQKAQFAFESLAARSPNDLAALFVAESKQNIHRLNIFAEGVWALQGAILSAIGALGCDKSKRNEILQRQKRNS